MSALSAFLKIQSSVLKLAHDTPLRVRPVHGDPEGTRQRSSVAREIEELQMHAVHHIAIMTICCRVMGIDVPVDCGVAPDTLANRNRGSTVSAHLPQPRSRAHPRAN